MGIFQEAEDFFFQNSDMRNDSGTRNEDKNIFLSVINVKPAHFGGNGIEYRDTMNFHFLHCLHPQ
jgi:hypothetical protein